MQTIRCPQCGLTNYPDDITYPRCGQCHEDLLRCTSCRHHEASGCHHARGQALYTPDQEAAKKCSDFRSRYEVRRPRMLWTIPAPVWVSMLLLAVIIGLGAAAWFIDPIGRYLHGNPIWPETVVPKQVTVGEPFYVTMRVRNLLNQTSTRIYIEIDKQFLAMADPIMPLPQPSPEYISRDSNRLVLQYQPLPAYGEMRLRLPFVPRASGTAPFIARIYAPSNQLRQEVSVPISVIAAQSEQSVRLHTTVAGLRWPIPTPGERLTTFQ